MADGSTREVARGKRHEGLRSRANTGETDTERV